MLVTVLTIALVAMTPVNPGASNSAPVLLGGGGPDLYGYTYLDSDTTCPGAPTYNWVSIKGIGTRITTLGDDNTAGPFDIGFEFPYYWYRVSQVYVGSNGYIAFHDNFTNASLFQHIPSTARTNNTLACLMSDLECSPGGSPNGSVWYWTNAAADTFIVEYDSIRFWSTGGNNSFQIIVSKPDSCITFQYKEQSGVPSNGWAPDNNQTGIENISGQIGLSYLSGTVPPGNMYHTDLAVRFIPPATCTLRVHDGGVRNAMNDRSGGTFACNTRPLPLWAVIGNFGNQAEGAFDVICQVKRTSGQVMFADTLQARAMNPSEVDSLNFDSWTPSANGAYVLYVWTRLTGDMVPTNDTVKIELRVVTLPATLTYDRGTPTSPMFWNGPGGFGNRFVPPVYPCTVTAIRIYCQSVTGVTAKLAMFDDNGPGGSPGDTFYIGDISVSTPAWYPLTLPTPAVITDGAFFVGGMSGDSADPSYGLDSVPPLCYQGWEYTGVWAPSRDASLRDVCANATVSGQTGISEWLEPAPAPTPVRIDVNPNPLTGTARVRLINPRGSESAVEIYDATGTVVRTLSLERGSAVFNGRDANGRVLAGGVYFARVVGADASVAKVIIAR